MNKNLKYVNTIEFENYLLLGLSCDWKSLNRGKPLVFESKVVDGVLVLSANLEGLERTKDVINNDM